MNNKQAATGFSSLSEIVRIDIAKCIAKNPGITASGLIKKLHMAQSTLSHHIKLMSDAGFLKTEHEGRWSHYYIDGETAEKLAAFLDDLK